MRVKENTLDSSDPRIRESAIKVDVRRIDSTASDLTLEFYGRIKRKSLPGVPVLQRPSASLIWKGRRIRGLDYAIKHEQVENGIIVGHIRGWHEHYWTDEDQDSAIREPNPPMRNWDLWAVLAWCSQQWQIEGIASRVSLFDE